VDVLMLRKVYGLVLIVHLALFALVFLSAPLIADFFDEQRLTAIVRVSGLHFLLIAPSVIPNAMLQRELEFKQRGLIGLAAAAISALATLGLALAGFGVWALVLGTLLTTVLGTVGINILHPFLHWPKIGFAGLGRLFEFGGHVAVSRVLLYVYLQADMIVAGRVLGKEQVGFYSVGMHLASLPLQRVSSILNEVAFPAFSRIQDDRHRVAFHLLQAIRLASLCSFPVFWGIGAVAPEIVGVLLGDKWQPSILPLQLLAIVMPLRMVGQLMPPTLQGVGKARLTAVNQLIACIVMVSAFILGVQFGIVGLSAAWLIAFPVTFLLNLQRWFPALGVPAVAMWAALGKPALASMGMFAVVAGVRALGVSGLTGLIVLIAAGAVSYAALSMVVNRSGLREARSLLTRRAKGTA